MQQGHFSIVVESNAPSQAPSDGKNKFMLKIVVPSVVGGVLLLVTLWLLVVGVRRHRKRKSIQQLEGVAHSSETLDIAYIGDTKVPSAFGTRTRAMIENDYLP
uniref:Uncharacterized protein n=2 Tax=Cajanus cajan TaxID=3821 RepID=A0A151RLC9_CAJCA|nr:hypothetical protein KK1_035191 [Cajanus cajan]